jgi:hypothetical protein
MVLLFWLSVEDRGVFMPLLMSGLVAGAAATRYLIIGARYKFLSLTGYILMGSITGLSIPLIAVLFMILKTGLHSHAEPDYTVQQILNVLYAAPGWLIGGGLIAGGTAIFRKS